MGGAKSCSPTPHCEPSCPTPRFTEQDEHVIQHCFHYTGTVLTSTLAFQKEQKLKCECQVSHLLQASLRDPLATSSAPGSHPQGNTPFPSGFLAGLPWGNCVTCNPQASWEGQAGLSRVWTRAAGLGCDRPLVFSACTTIKDQATGLHENGILFILVRKRKKEKKIEIYSKCF